MTISLASLLLAERHVSHVDVVFWLGILIVGGCLIAAGVSAYHGARPIVWGALLLVAIVAAILLLA